MTSADFIVLSPLIALGLTPIALMLAIAVGRRHSVSLGIASAGLIAAFALVIFAASEAPHQVTGLILIDIFGLFYIALTIGIALVVLALGYDYLAHREAQPEEYYILIVIATAGACVMSVSTHFISFYLGLEILSVAQYGLVAYVRRDRRGTEAGLKYLVLAAASAAFLLFGMALVYAELGTMSFADLANASEEQVLNHVVLLGVAMMFASIGFKLSIVPFHYWTPDIYEGAPPSVTAFTATAAKIGVFAMLLRYFANDTAPVSQALPLFVSVAAAASMILGNLMALIQNNLKRMLAYSSIAHMGYLAVAFLAANKTTGDTIAFYMIGYSAASLAAFGVIMALSTGFGRAHDVERLDDFRGLYRTNPALALVLLISLLSLAGIPLTVGFLGKLYIVLAGAEVERWTLLVILALSSAIGAYYYLRVALMLFAEVPADAPVHSRLALPLTIKLTLAGLTVLLIVLGVYPAPLLAFVHGLNP